MVSKGPCLSGMTKSHEEEIGRMSLSQNQYSMNIHKLINSL